VAQGRLDPQEVISVSDLDRFFLPATDGGAHPQFLVSLGEGRTSLTLSEAVDGMMIYSSNAAADYIASRLPDAEFPVLYRRLGLEQTDLPFSYLGLYLFMANHETGEYAQEDISLEEVRLEQQRLEGLFLNDPEWRAAELAFVTNQSNFAPVEIQKEVLNRYGMAGSARDMARVMLAAYGYNPDISPAMEQVMRRHLEWPMRLDPQNALTFEALAAKSGAWPGILTSAWYADPAGDAGPPRVLSVLYRDMPDDFWSAWLVSFSQQVLETRALEESDCSVFSDTIR
jgi:D-alanyl-D-alanine carboxypeptidase